MQTDNGITACQLIPFTKEIISWREARSSICRLVTGTEGAPRRAAAQAPNTKLSITHLSYRVQILHGSSYEKCQNVKMRQLFIYKKSKNAKR